MAMVNVRDAAGPGDVFNGTESVRANNSDGPRRIFFEPDGTAITAGNFSSTGGELLQKPDLTAATCVTTATPGFSTFCGTSSAAPHAAAIAALMLEAAGSPDQVTFAQLRAGMTTGTAVLDIEATGVDRDSGAGIVMAPGRGRCGGRRRGRPQPGADRGKCRIPTGHSPRVATQWTSIWRTSSTIRTTTR